MSAGAVAGPHCCRSVPDLKAASSLCFGRIGSESSRRRPGPNTDGKVTTTVRGSGAETTIGLPPTSSASPSGLPVFSS